MGSITSTKFEGFGTVAVPKPKRLAARKVDRIRRLWRHGFKIWAIAEEVKLTEWQVAKQLLKDGVPMAVVVHHRQLRNTPGAGTTNALRRPGQ